MSAVIDSGQECGFRIDSSDAFYSFFYVDANVYCHSRVGVRAGGPMRLE